MGKTFAVAIMGQSNAVRQTTGASDSALLRSYPLVTYARRTAPSNDAFEATGWAVDSTGTLGPTGVSVGIEAGLGRRLRPRLNAPLHIITCAVSGTNLTNHWRVDGTYPSTTNNLFTQAVAYLRAQLVAENAELAAVCWVQGEGDANAATAAPANNYRANLQRLIEVLRDEFHGDLIVCWNRLYPGPLWDREQRNTVRAAQQALHDPKRLLFCIESADLTVVDGQHYDADSLVELGYRFADVILPANRRDVRYSQMRGALKARFA